MSSRPQTFFTLVLSFRRLDMGYRRMVIPAFKASRHIRCFHGKYVELKEDS